MQQKQDGEKNLYKEKLKMQVWSLKYLPVYIKEELINLIDSGSMRKDVWNTLKESISRTGRVLFVNEDTDISNFGEHLMRRTCDELFYSLKVRPRVLAGKHIPGIGINPNLEDVSVPQANHIEKEMVELVQEQA